MVNRKLLELSTKPRRARRVARAIGVKVPRVRGRMPRPIGDIRKDKAASDRFMRAIEKHIERNVLRSALLSVLDLANCYVERLSADERRQLAHAASRAFLGGR